MRSPRGRCLAPISPGAAALRPTADAGEASLFGTATLKAGDVSGLLGGARPRQVWRRRRAGRSFGRPRLARRPARAAAAERKRGGIESRRQADLAAGRGRRGRSGRRAGAVDRRRNTGLEGGNRRRSVARPRQPRHSVRPDARRAAAARSRCGFRPGEPRPAAARPQSAHWRARFRRRPDGAQSERAAAHGPRAARPRRRCDGSWRRARRPAV